MKEFIDWFVSTGRPATGNAAYVEINGAQTTGTPGTLTASQYKDAGATLTSTNGIGLYWPDTDGSNGYAARGGHYTNGSNQAGVYHLDFGNSNSVTNAKIGFRCAYQ